MRISTVNLSAFQTEPGFVRLGATRAAHQPQDDVIVCLDPDGHPFCLWIAT